MIVATRPAFGICRRQWPTFQRCAQSTATSIQHNPLRILFCGADEFSSDSLRALHALQSTRPDIVTSIDVVCRPDKPVGRGLKHMHSVPIKSVASQLGLPVHEVDHFRDWTAPPSINLIVAVSFGLLVPARVLNAAEYGGLNVHPSLLPDLRGAAPIQHALLRRYTHTGVSLQTMHTTKFDHGQIVSQTPPPGVPIPLGSTPQEVIELLGPLGATMLTTALETGDFVRVMDESSVNTPRPSSYAPKITPNDRRIEWQTWTSDEIMLRDRVLGHLWDVTTFSLCSHGLKSPGPKRVTFTGPWSLIDEATETREGTIHAGEPVLPLGTQNAPGLGLRTVDGALIAPTALTIEGDPKNKGQNKLWTHLIKKRQEGGSRDRGSIPTS